jgi:hypothetical protein
MLVIKRKFLLYNLVAIFIISFLFVLITETVYAAPPKIEPESICQLYYYWECGNWYFTGRCTGQPCVGICHRDCYKYKVAPPACKPVLVDVKVEEANCTTWKCCSSP